MVLKFLFLVFNNLFFVIDWGEKVMDIWKEGNCKDFVRDFEVLKILILFC